MSKPSKTTAHLIADHKARLRAELAQSCPTLFPTPKRPPPRDFSRVWLGTNASGEKVWLDEMPRLEHCQAIGVTGSGKSNFLEHLLVQDIERGRGLVLLDPHGNHPDSPFARTVRWLATTPLANTSRVHIISPNETSHVVGFNPLAKLPGTALSVIADALLQAFERAWGDENTQQKPTIRSVLKATFIALAELDLTLAEAKFLYDQTEVGDRVRERVLSQLTDEYARDEIRRLHETARSEKSKRDFRAEVVGPINRINEFVSSEAIRAMVGQSAADPSMPARTLDLLSIMNRADILLVNLQNGPAVSEADTNLLGAILLRYLFLLASRRSNREPYFIYVDECHRYLTGDVPNLLAEMRKYGLGLILAHQYLAQLGEPTDLTYQALRNSTRIKAIFNIESAEEAQDLAELVLPLDLEIPVKASVRPTQVGHTVGTLRSAQTAEHSADSSGTSTSHGESRGSSISQGWSSSVGSSTGIASGNSHATSTGETRGSTRGISSAIMVAAGSSSGTASGHSDSVGVSGDPLGSVDTTAFSVPLLSQGNGLLAPAGLANTPDPWVEGMTLGQSDNKITSAAQSSSHGTSSGTTAATSSGSSSSVSDAVSQTLSESTTASFAESESVSESVAHSVGHASSRSTMQGRSHTQGEAESLMPVYEVLPSSFHGKDNARYMAGEELRRLPKGAAVIRAHGVTQRIQVPLSKLARLKP